MEQTVTNTNTQSPSTKAPSKKGDLVRINSGAFETATFERKWIPTKNERNFLVMMDVLAKAEGRGRLGMIVGPFGRGKTWTVRRYAAHNRSIYLLCWHVWKSSELGMLQALCRELGVSEPPGRKDACLLNIVDKLIDKPRVVFLDEMDLVPKRLDLVRQIVEVTASTFVLVGETNLADQMTRNGRTWSRTFQTLVMEPVSMSDIIFFARESAGLEVSEECAAMLHASPGGGDWRNLERLTIELVEICNNSRTCVVSEDMARQAVRMSLKGVAA
ncbi:MAG: AAA family ATPase [Syntrophobacteraceae bacterium]